MVIYLFSSKYFVKILSKPFRYKIIALVTIGQNSDQSVSVGSRFLWDADRDNFAAASWSNKHVYAVGTVYAVYYE